jgi:hypothetical protein
MVHADVYLNISFWHFLDLGAMQAVGSTARGLTPLLCSELKLIAGCIQFTSQTLLVTLMLLHMQRGPLHTTPLPKLEAALATQLLHVVGVIQHIRLTPLQRSVLENIIIAKVTGMCMERIC